MHRLLGYPPGREPAARVARRIQELRERARSLVHPRGATLYLSPERAPEVGLEVRGAAGLVVGLVTIGEELEAEARKLMEQGDTTAALVLDAIGSAAVEEAVDGFAGALCAGYARLVPGCGGWPLSAQRALFARLPAVELGVELSEALMMKPRKSVSFASWLVPGNSYVSNPCEACDLEGCLHRRDGRRN